MVRYSVLYCALILDYTILSAGVFAYSPFLSTSLSYTNCTLALQFPKTGLNYPLQLQLILTGIALIIIDVSASFLLWALKKLSCGVLAIIWFLLSTVLLTVWSIWSIVYATLAFPIWNTDRGSCDNLVMISMLVCTGLVSFYMVLYWIILLVVTAYDCWYRCDLECVCSCKRRRSDFQDF